LKVNHKDRLLTGSRESLVVAGREASGNNGADEERHSLFHPTQFFSIDFFIPWHL
jgi:hypothetical protein